MNKLIGSVTRPRIVVYRSNRYIYAQAVDDENRKTIAHASSRTLKKSDNKKSKKTDDAKQVGLHLSGLLKAKKIESAIYDRNRYNYKGRVKVLAEALREGGIKI